MEIGISSFGEVAPAHVTGQDYAAAQRMQELLAMGRLADEVGLDVLALGEHHRPDFIISSRGHSGRRGRYHQAHPA